MSYTVEVLTAEQEWTGIFNQLFDVSYPKIEEGKTMNWVVYDTPPDGWVGEIPELNKRQFFLDMFTNCARTDEGSDHVELYLWRKDGHPIRMFNVSYSEGVLDCLHTLYGPDANGSRSWLYDDNLLKQTREHFTTRFGVSGHKLTVVTDSSICKYYRNNPKPGLAYSDITETISEDGLLSTFTFTYTGE